MPGAFVLNLPEKDSAFDGDMYFTYIGCQSSNVGSVKGRKSGIALSALGPEQSTIARNPARIAALTIRRSATTKAYTLIRAVSNS